MGTIDFKDRGLESKLQGTRHTMNKKYWGLLSLPLFIGLIAALYLTIDPVMYYDPGWLIPVTNTLFVTLIYLTVAYLAMRSFVATGQIQIFLLACGTLIFGLAAACAGFARGLSAGANLNVTIYNTGALLTALFFSVAAMMVLAGYSPTVEPARRRAMVSVGYLATAIIAAFLTIAALRGALPPFFVQGAGPTALRQAVLGTADLLFVLAFLIFLGTYFRTREAFLYWYALSMALTSVSLTAFFIQSSVGSPVGWVGRISQYVGGAYLLVALGTVRNSASEMKTSFDKVLTFSFGIGKGAYASAKAESPGAIDRLDTDLKHIYLEESTDAFYVKDAQGRYLMFNSEAARVSGKKSEEVIGKDDFFLFSADEAKTVMAHDLKVMQGGQVVTLEEVIHTAEGKTTYFTTKGPLFDDQGKVVGLFGISQDVTESRRVEEALRKSEQEFRTLTEAMPQIVWTTRPDGRNTYFNQQWVDYTGMTLEESYGEGWHIPFHPDDRQRSREAWSQATATGGILEVKVRLRRADGAYRWWLIRGVPLLGAEGEILKWVGTCTDIEELKQAEMHLLQLKRLYATLSQVNATIVRVKDTLELYRSMCDVAVESGEFALAWIGLYDKDSGDVRPVAANGMDVAQWPFAIVNTAKGDSKDGLVANAIRSGKVIVTEDIETDQMMQSVITQIQGRDYHSIAAIPFRLRGMTVGALILVSRRAGLFEEATEIDLLGEMGVDISFALDSMATREERKQSERELRESYDMIANLTAQVPGVVYQYRLYPDGRSAFPFSSPGMNDIYEYSPEEVREDATPVFGRLHPDDYDRVAADIFESARTLKPFHCEFRVVLPRQGLRWRYSNAIPERTDDGGTLWYGIISDVTERVMAEEEIARNAALLERTGEMAKVGGWELDLRTNNLYWSPETYRIHEVDPLVSPSVAQAQDFYAPEAKADLAAMMEAAIEYGTAWDYQLPMTTARGRQIWVHGQGMAVMEGGKPIRLRGSFQDISDRKATEFRLRDLAEKIAGSLSSIVAVVNQVVEARDPYTVGHERRVSELAVRIAAEMGMSAEQVEDIRTAALLHDVGKASVPAELLSKPGRLSTIEFMLIKRHSESGFEILSSANMERDIAEMVYQHHERCDGSGYPRGLREDEILDGAKVIAVADVVEAMMSHRPYRAGLGVDAALAEIERGSGHQYNARVSEACLMCFRERGFAFSSS